MDVSNETKKSLINFHKLGRLVILNEEMYLLSEIRFNQIFEIGKDVPKNISIVKWDEKAHHKKHQKLCDNVKKYGKLMGEVDWILRDD